MANFHFSFRGTIHCAAYNTFAMTIGQRFNGPFELTSTDSGDRAYVLMIATLQAALAILPT
ncbi:hypothetical protein BFL40_19180 [Pseudomonas costantinii]|uniref:Uncharacterized protein n=1 Tax=Pseudomonas costantinii TaxID=168469 RepID=A0A1S2UVN3_9PSED|nr:hypothetical protein BFL40_19180 [Pseudomonas costantinii]